jgi:hypothetical protein
MAATNGTRLRAGLRSAAPAPTNEEAAAIVAALERFMRATAPPPAPRAPDAPDLWSQAAILEGVERSVEAELRDPWTSG